MAKEIVVGLRLKADGSAAVRVLKETDSSLSKVGTSGRKAGTGLNKTAAAAKRATSQLNLLRGASTLLGGYFSLQFARSIVSAGTEMEGFKAGLTAATGSLQGAQQALIFVRSEAKRLGLDFTTLAGSFTQLAAAARGTELEGRKTREIFSAVTEAGRVMNLSVDQTRGALNAIAQMMSKGTVQAEELRGQLGERLPGAFQIAARAMGLSTIELNKMLDRGELLAADLLPKMAVEIRKTFASGLPASLNSASASFARLNNSFDDLKRAIAASGLLEFLSEAAKKTTILVNMLAGNTRDPTALGELLTRRLKLSRALKQAENHPSALSTPTIEPLRQRIALIDRQVQALAAFSRQRARQGKSDEDRANRAEQLEREAQQLEREGADLSERLANSAMDRLKRVDSQRSAAHLAELARLAAEKAAVDKAARARESLSSAIDRLKGGLSEEFAASQKFRSAIDLLDRGLKAHIITQQEFDDISKLAMDQFSLASDQVETATDRQAAALRSLANTNKETFTELRHAVDGWARDFATRMVDGSGSFRGFVTTVLKELERIALAKATKPLFGAFGKLLEGVVSGFLPFAGGAGPAPGSFRAAQTLHSGGVAGVLAVNRQVPAGLFNGAPRYHLGGLAGNEVPAILRRGEEVLTRSDPRHRENAGSGGITIVNNIDARGADAGVEQRIQAAMRESEQRTIARIRDLKRRRRGSGL